MRFVSVTLNITHSTPGDLEIMLTSPMGTKSMLALPRGLVNVDSADGMPVISTELHFSGKSFQFNGLQVIKLIIAVLTLILSCSRAVA